MTTMEEMCKSMEKMAKMNPAEAPNFIVLIALRDELSGKLPKNMVDKVLAGIEIEVNSEFMEDKELFGRIIVAFAKVIVNIYNAIMNEFNNEAIFEGKIRQMTLTYKWL